MIIKPDMGQEKDPQVISRNKIQERICEIVLEQLRTNGSEKIIRLKDINPEVSFIDDLGADSIDVIEILTIVEEEFGLIIPGEFLEKMITVGDAVNYLAARV